MTDTFNPQFQKIGEILIHLGKLSESQLQEALVEQKNTKEKLGLCLINSGVITEDDLVTVYSMQLGYKKADEEMLMNVNQEAASLVPEEFARQNTVLAISKSNSNVSGLLSPITVDTDSLNNRVLRGIVIEILSS